MEQISGHSIQRRSFFATKCYLCKKNKTFWLSFAAETASHHKSIVITTEGRVVFGTDFLPDHPGKGFLCNKCYLCNKISCEFSCSISNKSREHCYRDTLSLEQTSRCSIQKGFLCNKTSAIINLKGTLLSAKLNKTANKTSIIIISTQWKLKFYPSNKVV